MTKPAKPSRGPRNRRARHRRLPSPAAVGQGISGGENAGCHRHGVRPQAPAGRADFGFRRHHRAARATTRDIANGEQGKIAPRWSRPSTRSSIMPLFDQCAARGRQGGVRGSDVRHKAGRVADHRRRHGLARRRGLQMSHVRVAAPDFLDLINTRVDELDVTAGGDGVTPRRGRGRGSGHRDRSAMVRELTEWWATCERRRAYIADGTPSRRWMTSDAIGTQAKVTQTLGGDLAGLCCSVRSLFSVQAVRSQAVNSVIMPLIIGSLYYNTPLTVSGAADRLQARILIVLIQSFISISLAVPEGAQPLPAREQRRDVSPKRYGPGRLRPSAFRAHERLYLVRNVRAKRRQRSGEGGILDDRGRHRRRFILPHHDRRCAKPERQRGGSHHTSSCSLTATGSTGGTYRYTTDGYVVYGLRSGRRGRERL